MKLDHAELGLESRETYRANLRRYAAAAELAERDGNLAALGGTLLDVGRVHEKLGSYPEAQDAGQRALTAYEQCEDDGGIAQCCHTVAVWSFHHGHEDRSFGLFVRAARTREATGEHLLAAQSWHNLGYVQTRSERAQKAFASYQRANNALDHITAGPSPDLAMKAHRNRAFVWSHLAFATAEHGDPATALDVAVRYFTLVTETGAHREPLLAYLGVPIAYARDEALRSSVPAKRLHALTGLPAEPETWFRAAIDRGRTATKSYRPGSGRRPYLGAMIVSLAAYGRWCVAVGRREDGKAHLVRAEELARARGWSGEVRRTQRLGRVSK